MEQLYTIKEASDKLNVCKETLRRWDRSGKFPAIRLGNRKDRRFRESALLIMALYINMKNKRKETKMIKNTSMTPNPEWLFGGNPNAIPNQEKEGQKQLISSSQLPKKGLDKEICNSLGIKIIGESKDDNLFMDIQLPDGFKLRATSHDMWSELLNENGDIVAKIFYKAAFYDRKATIHFEKIKDNEQEEILN